MPDAPAYAAMQPFMKLAQSNLELLSRFSTSPEVLSKSTAAFAQIAQQASDTAMTLMQSRAFVELSQGLLKNYTEFASEMGRSGMALWAQAQSAATQQVREAVAQVDDVAEARGRRARHGA